MIREPTQHSRISYVEVDSAQEKYVVGPENAVTCCF
jgi:hypothetical protein